MDKNGLNKALLKKSSLRKGAGGRSMKEPNESERKLRLMDPQSYVSLPKTT